ncbi:hypothetical protein SS50377_24431 [Spironucleus salmonicida]|uniref:SMI1/KNR4 family protein n=2 Tax=Spironucleus TaxID=39709 RepID=V6LYW3_9EUKA|nr:hypothetical protein [Spironucleus barkhanus]KAH0574473.1 hypothetical protein SS50377_24431 [Spironucleus salmonicida]|eukprot:EST46019.1 hypothetical protein SS50377_14007 [Spironucleus salmonicida]
MDILGQFINPEILVQNLNKLNAISLLTLNPGVSIQHLSQHQQKNFVLPPDLQQFYKQFNGFELSWTKQSVIGLLQVHKIQQLRQENDEIEFAKCAHGIFLLASQGVIFKPCYTSAQYQIAASFTDFWIKMVQFLGVNGWALLAAGQQIGAIEQEFVHQIYKNE